MGKTKRGKGTKLMAVADRSGLPLAVHTASASPHEVTLVKETLGASFVPGKPERLVGDRAYDSDPLDAELQSEGIEMIAPHRKNRKKSKTQEGASSSATSDAGRSRGSSLGLVTSVAWWFATSDERRTTSVLFS